MKPRTKNQKIIKSDSQKKSSTRKEFVETEQNLMLLLKEHETQLRQVSFKFERMADLLARQSAKKWSEKKRKKMQQQYAMIEEDLSFAKMAVDQISFRLSQVRIEQKSK